MWNTDSWSLARAKQSGQYFILFVLEQMAYGNEALIYNIFLSG